jgi:hypothetical protein
MWKYVPPSSGIDFIPVAEGRNENAKSGHRPDDDEGEEGQIDQKLASLFLAFLTFH